MFVCAQLGVCGCGKQVQEGDDGGFIMWWARRQRGKTSGVMSRVCLSMCSCASPFVRTSSSVRKRLFLESEKHFLSLRQRVVLRLKHNYVLSQIGCCFHSFAIIPISNTSILLTK